MPFTRLNIHISRDQPLLICNEVILSNLNACPLVWVFCNKGANKEIDRTHNCVLRMLYEDYECSLEILLASSGSVCVHVKNLQKLMTEIYKSTNHLSPSLVWDFHEKKHVEYNLRTKNLFCRLPKIRSTSFGLELPSLRGSFLWNTLDESIKNEETFLAFKKKTKTWSGKECTCRIFR